MRVVAGVDLKVDGHGLLVDQAGRFAVALGGRLDLLWVGPSDPRLEAALTRLPDVARGRALLGDGDPVDGLVGLSDGADALVVGPRKPGVVENLLLGTVASRVIRRARCAVYVPRLQPTFGTDAPTRIVVGIDGDGSGVPWLLDRAARFSEASGLRLDVVWADPSAPAWIPDRRIREAAEQEWRGRRETQRLHLESKLGRAAGELAGTVLLASGEAESALVTASESADLVVVGTRERHGVARFILGSVAEHVVQHSVCDVLTLPSGALGR